MGHIRLGRLPKTLRWRQVVNLLDEPSLDAVAVARATTVAAERRLRELARDPTLVYSFWLLTRLTAAARQPSFEAELAEVGLPAAPNEPILTFISGVGEAVRVEAAAHPESGHFAEFASLALRRALADTVGQHGPSLFGSSVEDLQAALRTFSSGQSFGRVARLFFGDFFAPTLRSFVERELSNQTGSAPALRGIEDSRDFADSLDRYARESARIMESFAAGWYGKHNWESKGRISRHEAQGFVAVALRKLRSELTRYEP
jgi:hypothetical protein